MKLTENRRYLSSLERSIKKCGLDFLRGRTVLITGASGMLGSCLADMLMLWNRGRDLPCRVIALGRSRARLEQRFEPYLADPCFSLVEQDVSLPIRPFPGTVDYIVHAASDADPASMAARPAEILMANVLGTRNLLDYGIAHGMERFLFVSSGEVYGQPDAAMSDFTEDYCGPLDLGASRSCYPEGKRAGEVICQSYIAEYGADAVIVRPCHLFGPTQTGRDTRAAAQFMRSAAAGEDIVLKSPGQLRRSQCYVVDAAKGLLAVLRGGARGEAYNIADRQYQMTVRQLATEAARAGGRRVVFQQPADEEVTSYSRARHMVLDAAKLRALGWRAERREASAVWETVQILRELLDGAVDSSGEQREAGI